MTPSWAILLITSHAIFNLKDVTSQCWISFTAAFTRERVPNAWKPVHVTMIDWVCAINSVAASGDKTAYALLWERWLLSAPYLIPPWADLNSFPLPSWTEGKQAHMLMLTVVKWRGKCREHRHVVGSWRFPSHFTMVEHLRLFTCSSGCDRVQDGVCPYKVKPKPCAIGWNGTSLAAESPAWQNSCETEGA